MKEHYWKNRNSSSDQQIKLKVLYHFNFFKVASLYLIAQYTLEIRSRIIIDIIVWLHLDLDHFDLKCNLLFVY